MPIISGNPITDITALWDEIANVRVTLEELYHKVRQVINDVEGIKSGAPAAAAPATTPPTTTNQPPSTS